MIFIFTSGVSVAQESQESFYAIKNRWNNSYLLDSNGYLYYSQGNPVSDQAYQWAVVRKDGEFHTIKNRKTGNLINTEFMRDAVQSDKSCPTTGESCLWALEKAQEGYIRLRNKWHPWEYIHVQDSKGYVQHGKIYGVWESAQWIITPVSLATAIKAPPKTTAPTTSGQPPVVSKAPQPTTQPSTQQPSSTQPSTPTTSSPDSPLKGAMIVNIQDFGAVGDGKRDNQAAIQNAINSAKSQGKTVFVPTGVFNHSGVLTLDGVRMAGTGDGSSVLHATNPDKAAIKLTGNASMLSALKTTVVANTRSSMPDAAAVLIQQASNAMVLKMTIQGACSNGIRIDNSTKSSVVNNLVYGTNADGIALMNGAIDNTVQKNVVYQAGDDSYSDDSYRGDARQDQNNLFVGNLSMDNAYGRGITLAGSRNDIVKDNIVSGSKWMGIFAATDADSGTMESSGHLIQNNLIINNPNGPPVYSNGPGVTVSGTITNGNLPSPASILGWDPGKLPDRYSFNPSYRPGTGSGSNNSGGNRT